MALVLLGVDLLSDDGDGTETFCDQLNEIYLADATAAQLDTTDVRAVRDELTAAAERFERLRSVAPTEIEADVDAIARFAADVALAARDHPPDEPFDRAAALSEASAGASAVEQALQRVDAFRATSC